MNIWRTLDARRHKFMLTFMFLIIISVVSVSSTWEAVKGMTPARREVQLRKIFAYINEKGQKMVWVNMFCALEQYPHWKTEIVSSELVSDPMVEIALSVPSITFD